MPAPASPQPRLRHGAPALLLLLTALATTLACHHLRPRDATFPWDSLQLLQAMAPSPPQPCHHQHAPFPFPDTLLHTNHPQQAAATALRILQHLFATLSSPSTPPHWDAQARHHLLNCIKCSMWAGYRGGFFKKLLEPSSMCDEANGRQLQDGLAAGQGRAHLQQW
ncbi:hypothetical protein QYF61_024513 [Mycteria americana]|uniref:Sulfhydryl oxidase n=1 Tax=Mycteria americana TaxID=33587 RepID=A0AAN7S268_MYCAM|nr:hypothetical protein QYF61_024513 [Mycteria americana]